ncbi:MAG: transglycosylase SLT domain-containing protein [Rhizobacter sp.]
MSPHAFRRWLLSASLLAALLGGCATPPPTGDAPAPAAAAAEAAAVPPPVPMAPPPAEAVAEAAQADAAPLDAEAIKPVDPLRPEAVVDLNDATAHADLWGRLRRGFAMPDLDTDLVRNAEQWYAARPEYVQRMTERGSRYLFHILEEVERRGMPAELALLPFVESAFNPQAMSVAKASGMWQFMPGTGRVFALKQNVFRDDRRDVLASTRAALDYLGRLHDQFGDWHLALAAYNWGEGNVQRAIQRNQRAGRPADYLSLRMPNETRNYVPKLQAVKNIVLRPEAYALALPPVANHPHFLSVPITRDIDVELAAGLADLPLDDFKALNPQMNKPVILAAGTPYVLLPYDNANRFVRAIADHKGPMATWTAWVAPKTLRPADAAKQVGMSEAQLREVNHIPPRMLVKGGSTLLVPRSAHRTTDVSEQIADNAMMALLSEGGGTRKVSLKAGRKDSVASIASRYRLPLQQVAQWNQVPTTATFKPGQTIVVYTAGRAGGTQATRRTANIKTTRPQGPRTQVRPAKVAKAP